MAPTTFITSLLALTTTILASPVPHPTSNFEYVGCVTESLANFPNRMPFDSTFSAEACLEACIGQAHLVAIGGGCYCDDPNDTAPVSFELVDEARCSTVCVPGDDASGKCGGDGVVSLWQLPGTEKADCKKAEVKLVVECPPEVADCPGRAAAAPAAVPEETVPPVIPTAACPPEGCSEPIPPTPVAQAQQAAAPCPPEGCGEPVPPPTPAVQRQAAVPACPPEGCPPATPVPAPIPAAVPAPAATPAPANNSTPNGCPPEGCVPPPASENTAAVLPNCEGDNCEASNASPAENQDEASGSSAGSAGEDTGAADEQSDASAGQNDATGEQSGASGEAPALVSESPRLYSSGVLSSIVAIIFGLYLM
ncbi:hypothetical protein CEP54_007193 [Fusarium duplospermum]|uniref:WSC domain-containing protein n=1 Tax=Fusarium duplospermum TaxID=1325734 RepID=A0A428Q344_9HYPO|nr:hypothetical protein CEP54_007193 [Fusarium duplospermum]